MTVCLLIDIVLPWVSSFLSSAELPGGWKFEFRELVDEQKKQRDEIESLQFLMTSFITDHELKHLQKLAKKIEFPYSKIGSFETELRRMRSLGLIEGTVQIRQMPQDGDLNNFFRITERGTYYLKLRLQWEADKLDAKKMEP